MKQVLQDLKAGHTLVLDVPVPVARPGQVLIATRRSLLSLGTERMLLEFGQANLIKKALQQPDRVRQVAAKVKTDGLLPTLQAVRAKLEQPIAMGYCNAGVIIGLGAGVTRLAIGQRVLSNGPHAEVISVPQNLCTAVPDEVSDDAAPFAVLGAVALQGVRLLQPTLGECFVVSGLGLIGVLAAQLLLAHGARVVGVDPDAERCELAAQLGIPNFRLTDADALLQMSQRFSAGHGVDGVLIAASTPSSEPVNQAAQMCRTRGRIVQVGATGLQLQRSELYHKELSFQVSCSYGPGRYDPAYEQRGHDYPYGFVRWTAQRNFDAVLQQLASKRLSVAGLIGQRFTIADAAQAYAAVARARAPGILLEYPTPAEQWLPHVGARVSVNPKPTPAAATAARTGQAGRGVPQLVLGVLGAGNFAQRVLLPALSGVGVPVRRKVIVSAGGVSASLAARQFGFEWAASSEADVLRDPEVNAVVITTQHHLHAEQTLQALSAGKHVFVEKPLCISAEQCDAIAQQLSQSAGSLCVGFNRRFAPLTVQLKQLLGSVPGPRALVYTVNAGALNKEHWTQDPGRGGGRLIGEACHFIDLLRHVVGYPILRARVTHLGQNPSQPQDVFSIELSFADGSLGSVHYLANGHNAYPKERLTVFSAGKVLELDNFRRLEGFGFSGFSKRRLLQQDKGHAEQLRAWARAVTQGEALPIAADELLEVSRVSIALALEGAWQTS